MSVPGSTILKYISGKGRPMLPSLAMWMGVRQEAVTVSVVP